MTHRVLFFGVLSGTGAGHYLYDPRGHCEERRALPPALQRLDGVWCFPVPRTPEECRFGTPRTVDQTEGRGHIHYVDGWTVVSWWDRSEDWRRGCCAVFLIEGRHMWADALVAAREAFPREVARMDAAYSIGLAGADLPPDGTADAAHAFVATFRALHPDVQAAVLRLLRGGR